VIFNKLLLKDTRKSTDQLIRVLKSRLLNHSGLWVLRTGVE